MKDDISTDASGGAVCVEASIWPDQGQKYVFILFMHFYIYEWN